MIAVFLRFAEYAYSSAPTMRLDLVPSTRTVERLLAACGLCTGLLTGAFGAGLPSDSDIHSILVQRIDVQRQSVGMVVGVLDAAGRRVVAYGAVDQNDPRPLNGDTVFQIGSATKVFTSLLLADMVERGEVALSDPVAKFVPAGVRIPSRAGHQITLQDLATQTSGLPRLPSNMAPKDPGNPYADYSAERLYQFLSGYELTRDIGAQYEYSNLGVGLLGHVLSMHAGTSYQALIDQRIARPLGLTSTRITMNPDMKRRSAVGHDSQLQVVPDWDFDVLAGAGALRSTANDLLTFLAANMGISRSPLAPAMKTQLSVRRPTGTPDLEIALGWHIYSRYGTEIVWHNGATYGFACFIGFDPKARTAVVVLSHAFSLARGNLGVDDIGLHLLNAQFPLATLEAPREHHEIHLEEKVLQRYVGRYELAPNFIITITQENDHLFAAATGQPRFEVFAESERDFFYKAVDAQIRFETDGNGKVQRLVLHQLGRDVSGSLLQ
jgi:CubicO group peptidase (beta-lactamase class C family)